jgi:LysM repeat protein
MNILNSVFTGLVFCGLFLASPVFAQNRSHKIKSGETLSHLARQYKTTVDALQRLNPDAVKGLKIGQNIRIPGEKQAEAPKQERKVAVKQGSEPREASGQTQHKVAPGESFSKIAKKYNVSVEDLEKWNGIKSNQLKAGQEIIVSGSAPRKPAVEKVQAKVESKVEKKETAASPGLRQHQVMKGETLSSIAQKEGSSASEIKKINQLNGDQLRVGQVLMIPENASQADDLKPNETTESAVQKVAASQPNSEKDKKQPVSDQKITTIPVKEEEPIQSGIREVNNTLGYTRVVETGFAEAIEGDINSKKHLCLHKTAAVGSILQVRNEVNGQSVFVKVIGKLPDTGTNEKIIIRITRQAYDRLMASGKRFPVEVSYPETQP